MEAPGQVCCVFAAPLLLHPVPQAQLVHDIAIAAKKPAVTAALLAQNGPALIRCRVRRNFQAAMQVSYLQPGHSQTRSSALATSRAGCRFLPRRSSCSSRAHGGLLQGCGASSCCPIVPCPAGCSGVLQGRSRNVCGRGRREWPNSNQATRQRPTAIVTCSRRRSSFSSPKPAAPLPHVAACTEAPPRRPCRCCACSPLRG